MGASFLSLPASGDPRVLGLWSLPSRLCFHLHVAPPLSVPSPPLTLGGQWSLDSGPTQVTQSDLTSRSLIISARTLSPNKVACLEDTSTHGSYTEGACGSVPGGFEHFHLDSRVVIRVAVCGLCRFGTRRPFFPCQG